MYTVIHQNVNKFGALQIHAIEMFSWIAIQWDSRIAIDNHYAFTMYFRKFSNVVSLKSRYTNMYVPSDFFIANFAWTDAFPMVRPFQLGHHCSFHLFHKDVEGVEPSTAVLDAPDSDHSFNAKVMTPPSPSSVSPTFPVSDHAFSQACQMTSVTSN